MNQKEFELVYTTTIKRYEYFIKEVCSLFIVYAGFYPPLIHQRFQLMKKPDNYIKKVEFYSISYKITCHHLSFHKNFCHMYSHYVELFA